MPTCSQSTGRGGEHRGFLAGVSFDADALRTVINVQAACALSEVRQTVGMPGLDEDSESQAAHEFARAIADLVGADARVTVASLVAEFDCIVSVVPQVPGAVLMEVMIFETELVVVWARSPRLGWWTFEGSSARSNSWLVIKQIVDEGGEVVVEKRPSLFSLRNGKVRILGAGGVTVSVMDDGGAGPWNRVTTFPSYRSQ